MTIAGTHNHLVTQPALMNGADGLVLVLTRWGDTFYAAVSDSPVDCSQTVEYEELRHDWYDRVTAAPRYVEFRTRCRSYVAAHGTTLEQALTRALEGLREGRKRGELR